MNPRTHNSQGEPLTRRQQQALARREQIVAVALELFAERGFAATTTKAVAKEANIAEGLIYHYFPTKADLLKAVSQQRNMVAGEVRALLEDAETRPATVSLRIVADGWMRAVRRESNLVRMLLSESSTNPELRDTFNEVIDGTIGQLEAYLKTRVQAGELREDLDAHASAATFFSPLVVFFITHHHLSDAQWQAQAEPFAKRTLAHWFRGALSEGER